MADQTVRIEPTDKAYTAMRLMELISMKSGTNDQTKTKEYWLKLYRQCYKATNGDPLATILEESSPLQ